MGLLTGDHTMHNDSEVIPINTARVLHSESAIMNHLDRLIKRASGRLRRSSMIWIEVYYIVDAKYMK